MPFAYREMRGSHLCSVNTAVPTGTSRIFPEKSSGIYDKTFRAISLSSVPLQNILITFCWKNFSALKRHHICFLMIHKHFVFCPPYNCLHKSYPLISPYNFGLLFLSPPISRFLYFRNISSMFSSGNSCKNAIFNFIYFTPYI